MSTGTERRMAKRVIQAPEKGVIPAPEFKKIRARLGAVVEKCPYHLVRMKAGTSGKAGSLFTRYYCPICGHSKKVPRPRPE